MWSMFYLEVLFFLIALSSSKAHAFIANSMKSLRGEVALQQQSIVLTILGMITTYLYFGLFVAIFFIMEIYMAIGTALIGYFVSSYSGVLLLKLNPENEAKRIQTFSKVYRYMLCLISITSTGLFLWIGLNNTHVI